MSRGVGPLVRSPLASFFGHGELVGPVVPALVRPASLGVPLHLSPSHLSVAPCRLKEPLPQVPVRHRLSEVVEPSVLPPLLVPSPPHAVDEVGAVRVDAHDVPFVYRFKSDARGGQFHPKVGGVQLAATYLLGFALPRHDGPVAAWAAGANGCPRRYRREPPEFPAQTRAPALLYRWM